MSRNANIFLAIVFVAMVWSAEGARASAAATKRHRTQGPAGTAPRTGPASVPAALSPRDPQPPAQDGAAAVGPAAAQQPPAFMQMPGAQFRRLQRPEMRPRGKKVREPVVSNQILQRLRDVRTAIAKSNKMISLDSEGYLWEGTSTQATFEWARGTSTQPRRAAGPAIALIEEAVSVQESLASGASASSVIGESPAWRKVTEATDVDDPIPFAAIGNIAVGCTGTLISSRLYITAAHCVWDIPTKTWTSYADLAFSPAQKNSSVKPYGTFQAIAAWVDGDYFAKSEHSPSDDWAVVLLAREAKSPLGVSPGWYGFKQDTYGEVRISGYPADTKTGEDLWTDTCEIENKWFTSASTHKCDTEHGNSGSGVALRDNANKKFLIAVHSSGKGGGSTNWACSFEGAIFDQIQALKKKHP